MAAATGIESYGIYIYIVAKYGTYCGTIAYPSNLGNKNQA